jgi:hypothetical protein
MSSSMMSVSEAKRRAKSVQSHYSVSGKTQKESLLNKSEAELREILLELQDIAGEEKTPKMVLIEKIQALQAKINTS